MSKKPVTMAEGKFLRLVKQGRWEWVQRTNITGVVGIIAVTRAGELLLVEQHRAPIGARCVELPAGLAGDVDANESLETSAARELEEETGYRPAHIDILTSGVSSAGLADEVITLVRATGLEKVDEGGGDEHETIEVHAVPVADVPRFLKEKQQAGRQIDLKVWAGLYFVGQETGDGRQETEDGRQETGGG